MAPLIDHPPRLQELSAAIRQRVPIGLASLSDRLGNVVLVKHSAGYITAYGNIDAALVKKGDAVKRGQTIATAGQTGNVTSPQLLFEVRKGAAPVNPRQ